MKLLTKEQEEAHYRETLKGGAVGGFGGLALGLAGVTLASRRYAFFRGLTIPLRAFLVTSAGTFGGIIAADHWSRAYEKAANPIDVEFKQREKERSEQAAAGKTFTERAMDFGKKERYKIVGGSWIASMIAAFALVNRNKFLTGQQKLVQARVYAQFLTLGVLVASAAFEINDQRNETGRYETVKIIDPNDPEHKRLIEKRQEVPQAGDPGDELWKDMIAAEEQRLKERDADEKRFRKPHEKKHKDSHKKEEKKSEEGDKEKKEDSDKKGDDKKKDDDKKEEKSKK